jgi:hypothetical protein
MEIRNKKKETRIIYGNEIKWNKIYFFKNVKWYFSNKLLFFLKFRPWSLEVTCKPSLFKI